LISAYFTMPEYVSPFYWFGIISSIIWWYWGLNSGLHTCYVGTLALKSPSAPFCVGYFWDSVSQTICLDWSRILSSPSLPPKKLGLQVWATGVQLAAFIFIFHSWRWLTGNSTFSPVTNDDKVPAERLPFLSGNWTSSLQSKKWTEIGKSDSFFKKCLVFQADD
jgi:hypothetical protein